MVDHRLLHHPASSSSAPEFVPVLGRGRHRSPRRGACFMEMASYLAGERWSDHPSCTQPLLAELARSVNDATSDSDRQRLVPMIPDVVGLYPTHPRVSPGIARLAASTALEVSAAGTQRVAAVGLLRCEAILADLEGRQRGELSPGAQVALAAAPAAADWAWRFIGQIRFPAEQPGRRPFERRTGVAIVRTAVGGIATACVSDPAAWLADLLARAIDLCQVAAAEERGGLAAHSARTSTTG